MNSRVGRLGGHSHDSRNLTFLFRSREATTHRVYLNEVDTPLVRIYTLRGFESVLAGCCIASATWILNWSLSRDTNDPPENASIGT